MTRIKSVHIKGYKSIHDADIELKPLNVIIGPNGSGKSALLEAIAILGDANLTEAGIDHIPSRFVPQDTQEIVIEATLTNGETVAAKEIAGTKTHFIKVKSTRSKDNLTVCRSWGAYDFSTLSSKTLTNGKPATRLTKDGTNLNRYLKSMADNEPSWTRFTRKSLQTFCNFPQDGEELDPSTMSAGSIRVLALKILLDQAYSNQPGTLIIEHPEAGVSETFLTGFAQQLKSLSQITQVIVTTHSSTLIDQIHPDDLIIAKNNGQSTYRRLDESEKTHLEKLQKDRSPEELWRMNQIATRT